MAELSRRVLAPKNRKTRRIDMSRQLTDTLRALLAERRRERLHGGRGEMPPWSLVTKAGTQFDGDNL